MVKRMLDHAATANWHALRDLLADEFVLVRFTARATGGDTRMPVLELLEVRNGRVARSDVFLTDSGALHRLLAGTPT